MAITITTLNNEAAAAKTFEEIGKDRVSSEYLNTSDSNSSTDSRLVIKQSLVGKTNGIPIRRSLVQYKITVPDTQGGASAAPVSFTVNLTLTGPTNLVDLTSTMRKDAMAFMRNLCTGSVVDRLVRGEV